jgi:hypothetical protein
MEQHRKVLSKLPRAELVKILKAHRIRGHSKLKKHEIVSEILRLSQTPEGGGLSDTIKKYAMKAYEAGKSIVSGITSRAQALKGVRLDYRPKDRKFIAENGDAIITEISVYRTPVESYVKTLANVLTLGKFGEILKSKYDDIYHLYLRIKLSNGKDITLEKNATIEINPFKASRDTNAGSEKLELDIPANLTFGEFLKNGQAITTPDAYFRYDPISTNCQQYLTILLKGSNIERLNPDANDFIFQDMSHLRNGLTTFQKKLFKGVTDLAGVADVAFHGAGLKKRRMKRTVRGGGIDDLRNVIDYVKSKVPQSRYQEARKRITEVYHSNEGEYGKMDFEKLKLEAKQQLDKLGIDFDDSDSEREKVEPEYQLNFNLIPRLEKSGRPTHSIRQIADMLFGNENLGDKFLTRSGIVSYLEKHRIFTLDDAYKNFKKLRTVYDWVISNYNYIRARDKAQVAIAIVENNWLTIREAVEGIGLLVEEGTMFPDEQIGGGLKLKTKGKKGTKKRSVKGGALQDSFQTLGLNELEPDQLKHYLESTYIQQGSIEISKPAQAVIDKYTEFVYVNPKPQPGVSGLSKIYIRKDAIKQLEKTLSSKPSSVQDDPRLTTTISGVNVYIQYENIDRPGNTVLLIGENHDNYSRRGIQVAGSRIVPFVEWLKKIDEEHKIYVIGESIKGIGRSFDNYIDTDRRDDVFGTQLMNDLFGTDNYAVIDKGFRDLVSNNTRNPDFLKAPTHIVYKKVLDISIKELNNYINVYVSLVQPYTDPVTLQSIEDKLKAYVTAILESYEFNLKPGQILRGKTEADIINPVDNDETQSKRLYALRYFILMFCDIPSLGWMYENIYSKSPINIVIVNGSWHTDTLMKKFFQRNYRGQNTVSPQGNVFTTHVNMKGLRFV